MSKYHSTTKRAVDQNKTDPQFGSDPSDDLLAFGLEDDITNSYNPYKSLYTGLNVSPSKKKQDNPWRNDRHLFTESKNNNVSRKRGGSFEVAVNGTAKKIDKNLEKGNKILKDFVKMNREGVRSKEPVTSKAVIMNSDNYDRFQGYYSTFVPENKKFAPWKTMLGNIELRTKNCATQKLNLMKKSRVLADNSHVLFDRSCENIITTDLKFTEFPEDGSFTEDTH
jgi:hypothetical protein